MTPPVLCRGLTLRGRRPRGAALAQRAGHYRPGPSVRIGARSVLGTAVRSSSGPLKVLPPRGARGLPGGRLLIRSGALVFRNDIPPQHFL
eukprot:13921003-Alexandrium_andersonii.AAC.1